MMKIEGLSCVVTNFCGEVGELLLQSVLDRALRPGNRRGGLAVSAWCVGCSGAGLRSSAHRSLRCPTSRLATMGASAIVGKRCARSGQSVLLRRSAQKAARRSTEISGSPVEVVLPGVEVDRLRSPGSRRSCCPALEQERLPRAPTPVEADDERRLLPSNDARQALRYLLALEHVVVPWVVGIDLLGSTTLSAGRARAEASAGVRTAGSCGRRSGQGLHGLGL